MRPEQKFHSKGYLEINQARFDHLESLGIYFKGAVILEVGAGIGDHTENLLNLGVARVIATDARKENLAILKEKFKEKDDITVLKLDIENPSDLPYHYDICYCYGLLYHLANPGKAIKEMAERCDLLLIESAVSFEYSKENDVNPCKENAAIPSHSPHGAACRPGRRWIFNELKKYFEFVYVPFTQPKNVYYPIFWSTSLNGVTWNQRLARAVFIGSRKEIDNPDLKEYVPISQDYFEKEKDHGNNSTE